MTDTNTMASAFVLDMLEETPVALGPVLDEVRTMRMDVKTHMDKGLSSAEMDQARTVAAGISAAEDILQHLFP